ncbi:hypothetical protein AJ80_06023 [Polytolypa hystricis UAMH7299]|uniref:Uncharacterized protein n=1 Tax=Polytolypa hystricis (strain UAMH7299) TaxID=1447883 RepID=A0A2B7XY66_POLH7|nr:hypothetical protein AJ80_06023 [Polytolypa hystricis UAMH7299]
MVSFAAKSVSAAETSSPAFAKLKELHVRNNIDCTICLTHPSREDIVFPFLLLPSLERLDVILADSAFVPDEIPQSPNLKSLGILNCGASGDICTSLLDAAPKLETLEYFLAQNLEVLKNDVDYEYGYQDEWKAFTSSLKHVSSTLKSLTVSVDFALLSGVPEEMDDGWVDGVWARRGCMGSLPSLLVLNAWKYPSSSSLAGSLGSPKNDCGMFFHAVYGSSA